MPLQLKGDIDDKFREEVFKRKGMKKGNLTEALEEAMLLWINTEAIKKKVEKNIKSETK